MLAAPVCLLNRIGVDRPQESTDAGWLPLIHYLCASHIITFSSCSFDRWTTNRSKSGRSCESGSYGACDESGTLGMPSREPSEGQFCMQILDFAFCCAFRVTSSKCIAPLRQTLFRGPVKRRTFYHHHHHAVLSTVTSCRASLSVFWANSLIDLSKDITVADKWQLV